MEIADRDLFDEIVGPSSDEDFVEYVEACRGYGITAYALYETLLIEKIEGEIYDKNKTKKWKNKRNNEKRPYAYI